MKKEQAAQLLVVVVFFGLVVYFGWLSLTEESRAIESCEDPCYLLSCTYMPAGIGHRLLRWNSTNLTYEAFHDFCAENKGYFTCATWTACTCHLTVPDVWPHPTSTPDEDPRRGCP